MTQPVVPDNDGRSLWRCDRLAALTLFLLAVGIAWQSRALPLGSLGQPGPAAWPLGLAVLLGLLAAAVFAAGADSKPLRALRFGEKWHALAILGAGSFAAAMLETLGYRLTVFIILFFLIGAVERRRLLPTLAVSAGLSLGTYLIFSQWLRVPLPIGLFGV